MRNILHSDLNNFYASVEIMLNPSLKGKNLVVGGSVADRHAIVLAKSNEAKALGVKTGETIWNARKKCKDLVIVPPNFKTYVKYSKIVQNIYYEFTNFVEPFGIDECWLDVTGSTKIYGTPYEIAEKISEKIKKELNLTVSIGVSFNKIMAKMASNYKKPDAITIIDKNNFKKLLWNKPAIELTGLGKKSYEKLKLYNINTIGDLANADKTLLQKILGKNGLVLNEFANGVDDRPVKDYNDKNEMKSIGNGFTLKRDLNSIEDVKKVINYIALKVSSRLKETNTVTNTIEIEVKDSFFKTKSFQTTILSETNSAIDIKNTAFDLFISKYKTPRNIRAITIRCSKLKNKEDSKNINIFDFSSKTQKMNTLDETLHNLRKTFGNDKITFGNLINEDIIPKEETDIIMTPSIYKGEIEKS